MRKVMVLLMALGLVVVFSGFAFAGGGDGFCSYGKHAKQLAEKSDVEKSEAAKTAATKSEAKSEANKLTLALETNKSKPAEAQK